MEQDLAVYWNPRLINYCPTINLKNILLSCNDFVNLLTWGFFLNDAWIDKVPPVELFSCRLQHSNELWQINMRSASKVEMAQVFF